MLLKFKISLSKTSEDADILTFLSKHKRTNIRIGVALNKNAPRDILLNLMNDENIEVVLAVAKRNDLSYDEYRMLYDKNIHEIFVCLFRWANSPEYFQKKILQGSRVYHI